MIIGLIGFKQVGKSTAAKYLESRGFRRINMKDALIAEMQKNLPDVINAFCNIYNKYEWDGVNPWTPDRLFNEKPLGFRELMQNYGTEVRRGDKDSYWTDKWKQSVSLSSNPDIVVDDVRFINEAEAVRSEGGILIRLVRPDVTSGGTHASEVEQLQIVADYAIEVGPGEHEKLYEELDDIIEYETNY